MSHLKVTIENNIFFVFIFSFSFYHNQSVSFLTQKKLICFRCKSKGALPDVKVTLTSCFNVTFPTVTLHLWVKMYV